MATEQPSNSLNHNIDEKLLPNPKYAAIKQSINQLFNKFNKP